MNQIFVILIQMVLVNYVLSQSCPGGWVPYNNRCFKIQVSDNSDYTTWKDADLLCQMIGDEATLASIHSPEENEFLYQEVLKSMNEKAHVWIGMHKSVYHIGFPYIWKDQSQVNYVNWDENEPNDIDGSQNCVRMYEFNGKWDDFDCNGDVSEEKHGYICESKPVTKEDSSVILPPLPDNGCCHTGDVFAIIFGIIIAIQIVLAVFGYLYFYKWDKQLPWQQGKSSTGSSGATGTPTSFDNVASISSKTANYMDDDDYDDADADSPLVASN